jgi:hypothetical protein
MESPSVLLRGCGRLFLPLGVDQLVEPADLALDRVEAVLLELEGVSVELFPGPGQAGPQAVAPFFHPVPAALKDAQPDLRLRLREEGEVHPEALVVVRRGSGLGEQLGEPLLALRGQPVDDLAAAAGQRRRVAFGSGSPSVIQPRSRMRRSVG